MKNKKWTLVLAILFMLGIEYAYTETKHIPTRNYQSAVYDSANKQVLIFGGVNQKGFLSDLWVFDIEKKTWKEIDTYETPRARGYHSAIYDPTNKQMVVFGNCGLRSDLWVYDIEEKTWEEIDTDKVPLTRSYHSAIYDSANKQMLIFGGDDLLGALFSDLWAFDIEKKAWQKIKTKKTPPARSLHSAIYDSTNKQMLIFGGRDKQGGLSDLWAFDIEKKTWEKIKTNEGPSARCCHSAIYDPVNKQMLVFGGSGQAIFSDLWAFDTEKKTWEKLKTK